MRIYVPTYIHYVCWKWSVSRHFHNDQGNVCPCTSVQGRRQERRRLCIWAITYPMQFKLTIHFDRARSFIANYGVLLVRCFCDLEMMLGLPRLSRFLPHIKGTVPLSKKLSNVCQLYVLLWSKCCRSRISHLFFSKITPFLKNRSYIIWAGDVIAKEIEALW